VVVVQGLGVFLARKAFASRQEEFAVGLAVHARRAAFNNAAAEMRRARGFGFLAEDDLDVFKFAVINAERCACQRCAVGVAGPWLRKAEIQAAVGGKVRIKNDVKQAALPARRNCRQARHRLPKLAARLNHPQAPIALGDQKPAVRQESHGPRVLQAGCHRFGFDALRPGQR
jgi:hypothetical protein